MYRSYSNNNKNLTLPTATAPQFTYTIPGMDIAPGPIAFTYVSEFLALITPADLPFDLVHEALHSNLTLHEFATSAIKIESGFIVLMSIFAVLTLVPLVSTCAWCCSSKHDLTEDAEMDRNAPVVIQDEALQNTLTCRMRASTWTLWTVCLLLSVCDFCIFYANSRLASSISMTPEMVQSTVHDVEVFLKDTHLQIKYRLDNGFHASVEKVVKDLEDVDVLLGEPIQAEISANTGIELAFDSLATISLANSELIYRVLMLQETVGRALKISQEAATRMEELQIQLSVLQRQCTYRDRPLCDTLRIRSFEENGVIDALKTLQEDQTIFRMRYLGEIEFGATVKNLTSEVGVSRSIFSNFPQQVKHDTAYQRNYTLEQLENIRHRTTANAQMLTSTITVLLDRLQGTWESVQPTYEQLEGYANTYWTIGWAVGVVAIWVLLFMLIAYCCYLCESHGKAGFVIFLAVLVICLASFALTLFSIMTLAIGGNSEIFLCHPLFDDLETSVVGDGYGMLTKLFDKPGYVYRQEPQTGIIGELLRPVGVNRSIVNVSLATALRSCEQNRASYNVFQLDAFVNITQIADLKQFPRVTTAIDGIDVSERTFLSLTQTIQTILENMLQTSTFNLTTYRTSIGAPTPGKDLATFIDQMQRVALQIQDVATSSRMTTLGSRSKRLQASILQPLEQLQNEILYHLTALELQRDPWAKQVNQTLNHLRNIQGYLERTAGEICHNQTKVYTERLKTYLTSSKATMSSQLGEAIAKCRPFFDIFDANRTFLCRNIVDFLNALWFFTFLTLLLWSVGAPVGLNMISIQRKLTTLQKIRSHAAERSRRRERETSTITARDRSSSSTGRPRPLHRSATEETLDIANESPPPPRRGNMETSMEYHKRETREFSRPREMNDPPSTPGRNRNRLRRSETDSVIAVEDNWGSSTSASRGTSRERETIATKAMASCRPSERKVRGVASSSSQQQQCHGHKPTLRKQTTEESCMDLDLEEAGRDWTPPNTKSGPTTATMASLNSSKANRKKPKRGFIGNDRNGPKLHRADRSESHERVSRRSMTPTLTAQPNARPARPMPRTPTRLRNRVSLTTRAVDNVMRGSQRNRQIYRTASQEYDVDDGETYGASASNPAAVAAARRTPPRTAPPPPPPPGTMNRHGSVRSVRWPEDMDEDLEIEDVQ